MVTSWRMGALLPALPVCGLLVSLGPTAGRSQSPLRDFVPTWSTSMDTGRVDRGTGIVHFAVPTGSAPADTILLRATPSLRAKVVGAFLYDEVQRGDAWRYGVLAPRRLAPNVVEYGYEESGVPLDSLIAQEGWGRVILGFDDGGMPYRGWVQIDPARVRYLLWSKVLAGNRIFFLPDIPPRFFDAPEGRPVSLTLGAQSDYIMHPLEAQGSWLRVRVAQPSDMCGGPDEGQVRNTVAWIQYLTPRGRPRVWYYSRGC